jgi:transcriptional regulator with XRE-family HTH domain
MGLQQELGRQVRRHRDRIGMSQVELADAIGRSVQMIGRIERGRSAPSFATLEEIARVLQTPLQDFFGFGEPDETGASTNRIMHRLSLLSSDEIEWVDQIIVTVLRRPSRD